MSFIGLKTWNSQAGTVLAGAGASIAADNATVSDSMNATVLNSGTYADGNPVTMSANYGTPVDNEDNTWDWSWDTSVDGQPGDTTVDVLASFPAGKMASFTVTLSGGVITATTDPVAAVIGFEALNSGTHDGQPASITANFGIVQDNGDQTWDWTWDTTGQSEGSPVITVTATYPNGQQRQDTFTVNLSTEMPAASIQWAGGIYPEWAGAVAVDWDNSGTDFGIAVDNATVFDDIGDTAVNTGTYDGTITGISESHGTAVDDLDGTWSWSWDTTGQSEGVIVVTVTVTYTGGFTRDVTFNLDLSDPLAATTVYEWDDSDDYTWDDTATYEWDA